MHIPPQLPTYLPQLTNSPIHPGLAQASPLSAHIRVPLTWYHSATFSHYPDETPTQIRRVYENPFEAHTRRTFCGVCGTPLTYWSEHPHSEADYIHITLGSLRREDLGDLEDLGLLPESPVEYDIAERAGRAEEEGAAGGSGAAVSGAGPTASAAPPSSDIVHREIDIPWFDSIMEGSRLGGRLRTTRGTRQSADGTTRIEFEITEYTDEVDIGGSPSGNGKRKLGDRDDADQMEGVNQS